MPESQNVERNHKFFLNREPSYPLSLTPENLIRKETAQLNARSASVTIEPNFEQI